MHHIKIKTPRHMPPVPAGRFNQSNDNFLACSALKECTEKCSRQVRRCNYNIACSGSHQCTTNKYNLEIVIITMR